MKNLWGFILMIFFLAIMSIATVFFYLLVAFIAALAYPILLVAEFVVGKLEKKK